MARRNDKPTNVSTKLHSWDFFDLSCMVHCLFIDSLETFTSRCVICEVALVSCSRKKIYSPS